VRVIVLLIAVVYLEKHGYDVGMLAGTGLLFYALGLDLLKNY